MAEKLEIVIAAKDQASAVLKGVAGNLRGEIKGIEGASKSLAASGNQMAGTTVAGFGKMKGSAHGFAAELNMTKIAMAGMAVAAAGVMTGLIQKAAEAEAVTTKLRVAIASSGKGVELGKLEGLAQHYGEVTTYSKDAIEGMMSFLVAAHLNQDQIEKLTPAIMDMATFLGIDLAPAAKAVGMAIERGSTMPLMRLKLAVDNAKFALDPIGAILDAVKGKAGGLAEETGKDAAGQLKIFTHQVEELEKALGRVLLPTLKVVTPLMTDLAKAATALSRVPGISQAVSGIVLGIGAMGLLGMVGPPVGKGLGMLRKVPGIGKMIGGIAGRFGGAAAGTIAGEAVMGAAAVAAPAAASTTTIVAETAIASAAATTAANVGTRIGIATGLRAIAGKIGGAALGLATGPVGIAAAGAAAIYGGVQIGMAGADESIKKTEELAASPGRPGTRARTAYDRFMAKWRIGRVGAGLLSPNALTPDELAQARLDPAARLRIGEEEAKNFQAMAAPAETVAQRKHREAMFPQQYTGEELGAMAGMQRTGPTSFFIPYEQGTNRLGRAPGAAAVPVRNNARAQGVQMDMSQTAQGPELLIRVPMSSDPDPGALDDATTAYLDDIMYAGDDF